MKIRFVFVFTLIVVVLFSACEKEYFKPASGISATDTVSFSKVILPLLKTQCAVSGCHQGSVPPDLSDSKAYGSLVDGALVDTLNPDISILMVKLNSNMPPAGKLPAGDISNIRLWIKQGAHDN